MEPSIGSEPENKMEPSIGSEPENKIEPSIGNELENKIEPSIGSELENHWLGKILGKALASSELLVERVELGLKKHNGDRDKNADWLISRKTAVTSTCGVVSGATSFIPVLGSIAAMITTGVAEFALVLKLEIELCIEIAHNYGHTINDPLRMYEVLAIIGRKRAVKSVEDAKGAVTLATLHAAINRYVRIGIVKALTRTAELIELRMGLRAVSKAVPVIGVLIGGAVNYVMTQNTGKIAKEFYKENVPGN
jgi:hypothetical protein